MGQVIRGPKTQGHARRAGLKPLYGTRREEVNPKGSLDPLRRSECLAASPDFLFPHMKGNRGRQGNLNKDILHSGVGVSS